MSYVNEFLFQLEELNLNVIVLLDIGYMIPIYIGSYDE